MTSDNATSPEVGWSWRASRRGRWAAIALAAVGVAIYASATGRRFTAGTFFLSVGAAALTYVALGVYRTVQALLVEPAAEDGSPQRRAGGRRWGELEREKQRLLKAIKEIEFDRQMGKLSESDFQESIGRYRARAMRIIRQLDPASADEGGDYRALIEAELKARRKVGRVPAEAPATPPGADAGIATAATGAGRAPTAASTVATGAGTASAVEPGARCAACGTSNDLDAAFCKRCGKPLRLRCAGCTTDNDGDAAFCKKCGGKLALDVPEAGGAA